MKLNYLPKVKDEWDEEVDSKLGRSIEMRMIIEGITEVGSLLQMKFNTHINDVDKIGRSALMYCIEKGDFITVKWLLSNNCNVNLLDQV